MANRSVDFVSDKPSSLALSSRSTINYTADMLKACHELKIAYRIMSRHPDILNEFIHAVKGGANLPAEAPTASEESHHV
jgi:hypothetical protein